MLSALAVTVTFFPSSLNATSYSLDGTTTVPFITVTFLLSESTEIVVFARSFFVTFHARLLLIVNFVLAASVVV